MAANKEEFVCPHKVCRYDLAGVKEGSAEAKRHMTVDHSCFIYMGDPCLSCGRNYAYAFFFCSFCRFRSLQSKTMFAHARVVHEVFEPRERVHYQIRGKRPCVEQIYDEIRFGRAVRCDLNAHVNLKPLFYPEREKPAEPEIRIDYDPVDRFLNPEAVDLLLQSA